MKNLLFLLFFLMILTKVLSQEKEIVKNITVHTGFDLPKQTDAYAPVTITTNISLFPVHQQDCIKYLIKTGRIIDEIFWQQSFPNGLAYRNELLRQILPDYVPKDNVNNSNIPPQETISPQEDTPQQDVPPQQGTVQQYANARDEITNILKEQEAFKLNPMWKYFKINYGPFNVLNKNKRWSGGGADTRPPCGGFYPEDMTKEEFENTIKMNPGLKDQFESPYTVITRVDGKLVPVKYSEYYRDLLFKAKEQLLLAAQTTSCPPLTMYMMFRAEALINDVYFPSDLAWMDVKDCNIDVIIGPIENYQDELFNYKTAYECIVMAKDIIATNELNLFKSKIDSLQQKLPCDKKYIPKNVNSDNSQLNIVNVVYASGDCMKGTKTIASSLPNDPKVRESKGGKNYMFKNFMQAKFEKIVVPIAELMLDKESIGYVDSSAFMSFVTLHEISHTLGRAYVYGKDTITIRMALKDRFSSIEELKADILSIYYHKILKEMNVFKNDQIKKAQNTYLAGLFRSLRFGASSAHGKANTIQFNYLFEKGAIKKNKKNLYSIDDKIFFDKVKELANKVLTIEATGDYLGAGELLDKYGKMKDPLSSDIEKAGGVPTDIDVTFEFE